MPDTITITDDRNGKQITVPITNGTIPAVALRELDPTCVYDPALMQTAACASSVTYLDGDAGILRYRGYPIEQLAEDSTYLEVAYLLLNGELPTAAQLETWVYEVTHHTFLHDNVRKRFMEGFHYDAHPMGMFVSGLAALSTYYLEAKEIHDLEVRDKQVLRLIAKAPTLAAYCHRFSVGLPTVYPDNELSYAANFLNMMWKVGEYEIDPVLEHALDVLFILHADHEQNCGTTVMRVVGSSARRSVLRAPPPRPPRSTARCTAAPTSGRAHARRDRQDRQRAGLHRGREGGQVRLMGFGHRVYKNYDPRARIIKHTADEVFEVTGKNPLLDIALKLEEVALSDDYFSPASSTRTSTSTRASSTRPWVSRWTCSPCCSPSPARRAGWRTGWSCWATRSRRSPGPGRPTSGEASRLRAGDRPELIRREPIGRSVVEGPGATQARKSSGSVDLGSLRSRPAVPICVVDAFTDAAFGGNPAAVCRLDRPADAVGCSTSPPR